MPRIMGTQGCSKKPELVFESLVKKQIDKVSPVFFRLNRINSSISNSSLLKPFEIPFTRKTQKTFIYPSPNIKASSTKPLSSKLELTRIFKDQATSSFEIELSCLTPARLMIFPEVVFTYANFDI